MDSAHDIILAEFKENAAAICRGEDPMDEPGGIGRYMERFTGSTVGGAGAKFKQTWYGSSETNDRVYWNEAPR